MHMLSKKDLRSAEMDTLGRSRTPFTVVNAKGEIPTTEEAQVYVHDQGLFVTVQVLEETSAVVSLARSGRVKRRATPTERMTARVFREAGACVRQNAFLRDMKVNVPALDSRNIEVLAQRFPCHGEVQLAVDITLRSLSCDGQAHPHAADHDGAVFLQARPDKETTYRELASSGRCKLNVLAIETGGRWSEEAVETMKMLAHSKERDAPSYMQFPVALMWERTWTRMLPRVLRRVLD